MRIFLIGSLLCAAGTLAFGQLDDNTISVTTSRTLNMTPDQAVLLISVTVESSATLDDVLGILKDTGITAKNLLSVAFAPQLPPFSAPTAWTFSLPVLFSKLNSSLAALTAAQRALPPNGPRSISYSLYAQTSAVLQASQSCPWQGMIADAQAQARQVAAAAGVNPGGIVSVSEPPSTDQYSLTVPSFAFRSGNFTFNGVSTSPFSGITFAQLTLAPLPLQAQCILTVQFKLIR